jgi:DNA invertase Pin-like site-specific DNA recombinase
MNIAAYLRVSTAEQNADNQLPAILDYCKAHWWPEPEMYAENESAWRSGHQHELARLLKDIRNGRRYDIVLIWALDRLSRGGIGPVLQLVDTIEAYGAHVISIQETWTSPASGPMREMFIAMAAWAAKFESDRKSINTKAGLARARAAGVTLGRPVGKKDSKQRRKKRPVVFKYGGVSAAAAPGVTQ